MLALAAFVGTALASAPLLPGLPQGQAWDARFFLNGVPGADVLEIYDDGSGPALYVAGGFTSADDVPMNRIARWTGQGWAPLGAGLTRSGPISALVLSMAVFDGGSGPELYVGGNFAQAGTVTANGIARWNGTRWAAVGNGAASTGIEVRALTVFDDGSGPALYAGGFFSSIGGTAANGIARWNGTSWTPLGAGFASHFNNPGFVEALAGFQGMLYAGGEFERAGGEPANRIARWDGTAWKPLGSGADRQFASIATVFALEVCEDQRGEFLAIGGDFNRLGGKPAESIGRWDGVAFEPIGPGLPSGSVKSLAQFDDGAGAALYAGGLFFLPGTTSRVAIARWDGRSWALVGDDLTIENGTSPVSDLEVFDDGDGRTLFAAGPFAISGERVVVGVAELRGGEWFPPSARGRGMKRAAFAGDATPVAALEVWDDGLGEALYAAGNFKVAGTTMVNRIAKWNGEGWSPLGQGFPGDFSGGVGVLEVFDDGNGSALYAGGTFQQAGSVAASRIARWDGVTWWPLGAGLEASAFSPSANAMQVFDDGSGPALYVGGAFTEAGDAPANGLAKWDGTAWSDVGGGVTEFQVGIVHGLAVFDDGSGPALFVGGGFDAAGGTPVHGLAKWDGTSWSDVGGGVDQFGSTVYALATFDDGAGEALYVGGSFFSAGNVIANNLARWDGSSWTALSLNGSVYELVVHDDGSGPALHAGGEFTRTIANQTLLRVGRWDGLSWSSLGTGVDGSRFPRVEAFASFSQDGIPALYVGGNFDAASGRRSSNIARWFDPGRRRVR